MLSWDVIICIASFAPTPADYLAIASINKEMCTLLTENENCIRTFAKNHIKTPTSTYPFRRIAWWRDRLCLPQSEASRCLDQYGAIQVAIEFYKSSRKPGTLRDFLRGRNAGICIRKARLFSKKLAAIEMRARRWEEATPINYSFPNVNDFARWVIEVSDFVENVRRISITKRLGTKLVARAMSFEPRVAEIKAIIGVAKALSWV